MAISRRALLRRAGAAVAIGAVSPIRLGASGSAVRRGPASVRLSHNESAYGASPEALATLRQVDAGTVSLYPDVEYEALRRQLAARHGVAADRVALGCGSAGLLRTLAGAYLNRETNLVVAHPTCPVISLWGVQAGAAVRRVPLAPDWSHDLAAMARSCDRRTGLVYLCNPNNPTGSLTRRAAIEAFLGVLPATTLVVVDEAYHDYVTAADDYASFLDRPVDDDRIVVLRSFSKAHGLAGLRLGYTIAHPRVAERMGDVDGSPVVSSTAALAAAAALADRSHVQSVVSRVADDRQEFYNQANARMLRVIDSHANFVMLDTGRRAADIVDHFARNGIGLAPPFEPLEQYVRVTLGTASDMAAFWRVWDLMSLSHTL